MVSIYYAHPKFMYGTKHEEKEIETIAKHFQGAKITNPANVKFSHRKRMSVYAYYASLHDIIVYRPVVGRFITAGVYEEVEAGVWKGAKIVRISEKGNAIILEEVSKVRDYPLTPKESNLIAKVLRFESEQRLIEEISDLRSRYRLTPRSALILVCTRILAKLLRKNWVEVLQKFMGGPRNIPKHWLRIIKMEKARTKILEMMLATKDVAIKLILHACLKFIDSLELKSKLMKGKYNLLPERVLAYYYAIRLREEGLSYEKIAREIWGAFGIKVSSGEVCNWIRGRYNPLRRCGCINDCPDLGYVIAAWLGDGSLAVDRKAFKYYVELATTKYEFAREWGKRLAKVTGKSEGYKPRWDKCNKRWVVRASNIFLWMILSLAREDPWFVYPILERYPGPACRGWFDAEGSVSISGYKIVGTNTDLRQIRLIQELLHKLSINSKYYPRSDEGTEFKSPRSGNISKRRRTNYDLVIYGRENQLKYRKFIGFSLSDKKRKLDSLLGDTT